jgi:phosphate transport system substrate-binding protein
MKRVKRTLATLVFVTTAGCTMRLTPATPPEDNITILRISNTYDTTPLVETFTDTYLDIQPKVVFERAEANYETTLNQLQTSRADYIITNHLGTAVDGNLWAAPVAQDGLVIITHADNPVSDLTIEEVRRIYRGYVTNWQEVGGADMAITLLSREAGSGTRLEFERLVMGQQRTSPNAQVLANPAAIVQRTAETPGAIAYLPLSLVAENVRVLAIEGITPSLDTIGNNSYPLRYTIYIIGLAEPEDAYRNFIGWMQGAEGQNLIRSRYVPLP